MRFETERKFSSSNDLDQVTDHEYKMASFFVKDMLDRSDIFVNEEEMRKATMVFLKMKQMKSYGLNINIEGV